MYIVIFFVILAVLVLVHEFGHFYAAKKSGVRVDEFGLGFPPRLWSWQRGETTYSVNAIPFGGFVKIFGENNEDGVGSDGLVLKDPKSFVNKPKWIQVIILSAGVIMNIVFAWALFSVAYMSGMTTGISEQNSQYIEQSHIVVIDVMPNSPADRAGLAVGDEIFSYNFSGATTTITGAASIQDITKNSGGKPIRLEVLRMVGKSLVTVIPVRSGTTGDYMIGIAMDIVGSAHFPFGPAVVQGAKLTWNVFAGTFVGLYGLIHDAFLGHADISQLSGPVGIARLVGDASRLGFVYLLSFTGFISLNLAVLNLIPFPALDGGRILFVIIEAIRRKTIHPRVANTVNAIGFGLLILLMLFITYRDVMKLV